MCHCIGIVVIPVWALILAWDKWISGFVMDLPADKRGRVPEALDELSQIAIGLLDIGGMVYAGPTPHAARWIGDIIAVDNGQIGMGA